ncbi:MAG: hypothetical protein ABIT83_08245 [Massilia sp.]
MRRFFSHGLRLGVASDALALVETARWQAPRLVAETPLGRGDDIGAALGAMLEAGGYSGRTLTVVLADELVRLWQVTPPEGSTGMGDLEAAASLRFQALFGEPPLAWRLSASWDARRPFLAAAVKATLREQLDQGCAARRLTIVECAPQFVAALNQWSGALREGAWFGLVHEHVLTLGVVEQGAIGAVRAVALPEGAAADWLAQHVEREALRLNVAAPARLQLCGQVPAAWLGSELVTLLGGQSDPSWSGAARLALTGSAA